MSDATASRCQTCRFWLEQPQSDRALGECRRHPPTLVIRRTVLDRLRGQMRTSSAYPDTRASEWCGEHRARLHAVVIRHAVPIPTVQP